MKREKSVLVEISAHTHIIHLNTGCIQRDIARDFAEMEKAVIEKYAFLHISRMKCVYHRVAHPYQ